MTPDMLTVDSMVVSHSARMRAVFEFLRVIGSESTVLITETAGCEADSVS